MSNTCTTCESTRLASIRGKTSDRFYAVDAQSGHEHEGYVPGDLGIGCVDYIRFTYCLQCGQIQGSFPQSGESISGRVEWEVVYLAPWNDDYQTVIVSGDAEKFDDMSFENMVSLARGSAVTTEELEAIEIVEAEQV